MALKSSIRFSRERLEFYYSVLLIILIPTLLIANTLWLVNAFKTDFDVELRRKANLANEVAATAIAGELSRSKGPAAQAAGAQQTLDAIKRLDNEVSRISVLVPDTGGYKVLASSEAAERGKLVQDIQTNIAWSEGKPIAALITSNREDGERVWRVLTPVFDAEGKKVAISSIDVTLSAADVLIAKTTRTSLIFLSLGVGLILLLLVNHFRFIEYAQLFRKQRELDQMKDDFISVATHELKAPMTIIKGYISNVLDGEGKIDAVARESLTVAFNQTDRLARLVADLLNVSRLEQGRTKFTLSAVALPDLLGPLIASYRPRAAEKGLKLVYEPPANVRPVLADIDRLAEVFTNLIDNAIKYSLKGSVTISHVVEGGKVRTVVRDTGIGISAEERDRLFQRFYRVRNKNTEHIEGTGLGLWIIKQYVEKMKGKIYIDSIEGEGSAFSVELPVAKGAKEAK